MASLSSPLSRPSCIAEAGETSKPKKKAATFNTIPSLSVCVRAAAPEPKASGEPGATCCGALFRRFCATAGLEPPGLRCQDHQAGTKFSCALAVGFACCRASGESRRLVGKDPLAFSFLSVLSCLAGLLRGCVNGCFCLWCSLVGHRICRRFKHWFCVFDRTTPPNSGPITRLPDSLWTEGLVKRISF